MIYSNTQPNVGLTSTWRCTDSLKNSPGKWTIIGLPSSASAEATFAVELPFDAVISRVWLEMGISSPLTGSAYQRVNGISIPSSGVVELPMDSITAETASFDAVFTFRANGAVHQNAHVTYEARLTLLDPTLYVEYVSISQPGEGDDGETIIGSRPLDTGVQLPRLLDGDFREVARIDPSNLQLKITADPLSGATMRMPLTEPTVKVGDFLELFSPHGSVGIYRAIEVETIFGANEATIYMEHAIGTLADSLAIGQQAMAAPVATVFATLLETQNVRHWVMGDCEVPEDYELVYEYSYDNLLQAVTTLTKSLPPEYMWEFDTMQHPFVMHLRKLPADRGCEGRLSRNLSTATLTVNRQDLCTRLVPFGAGEGTDRVTLSALTGSQHIDSPTAETWGIVSRTITAEDVFDAPTLKLVAERYLDRYGTPLVSVTMDAVDLYRATGEKMDFFRPGALCRLALPDYGVTIEERVVQVVWPDVFGNPEKVDVTLANRIRDAADEIAELMREATNIKLINGEVETVEESARAGSITPGSPFVQSFEVSDYGNLLNVKTKYSCVTSSGDEVSCHVAVDGNEVDESEAVAKLIDITRYLAKDEAGVPTVGTHRVRLQPATLNTVTSEVGNTITIKQIKKR